MNEYPYYHCKHECGQWKENGRNYGTLLMTIRITSRYGYRDTY